MAASDLPRTVLVASDLTELAEPALTSAGNLARRSGGEVQCVHVIPAPATPGWEGRTESVTVQGWIHEGRRRLDEQLQRTLGGLDRDKRVVTIGRPYQEIASRAEAVSADLIVLGPHQPRMSGRVLGTTADRVVRTLDVPCLIANRPLEEGLTSIVIPVDLSRPARAAMDLTLRWVEGLYARDGGGPITAHLLYVASEGDEEARKAVAADLEQEAKDARAALRRPDSISLEAAVIESEAPVDGILAFAGERGAQLIALGTRGLGTIQRALVGSVASAVARQAPCPVLLVPPGLWADDGDRAA
jgi:nucleotide-binding universal stress UspA family protein